MTTGERIKLRRKELGITADDLAILIGVSRSTMFRYENGDIEKLPGDSLVPIANALRTTPQYLMGWTEKADAHVSPVPGDVTPKEYSLILSYRKATAADRQIIDNIVSRYPVERSRPLPKSK